MSRKWLVISGCVCAALVFFGLHDLLKVQVSHAMQATPGAEPVWWSSVVSVLAQFGGLSGVVGAALAFVHKWEDTIPVGPSKKLIVSAVSAGEQAVLAQLYKTSSNAAFRKSIRDAAKADDQTIFDSNFPLDDKIDGVSAT